MSVKHLGQFGPPRPSDLSGLSESIASGIQTGENSKRTKILQQQADTQTQEAGTRTQLLKSQLMKAEREEEDRQRKMALETVERLSIRLSDKSKAEEDLLLDTPPFKDLAKDLIKTYLPEAYDEKTQRIILTDMKWIPKTREEQLAFKESIENVTQKARAGQPLSSTDLVTRERSIIISKMSGMISLEESEKQLADIHKQMDALEARGKSDNNFTGGLGEMRPSSRLNPSNASGILRGAGAPQATQTSQETSNGKWWNE